MPDKQFKIAGSDMKALAEGLGACMATDAITVEGRKVGHMYREEPFFPEDSGWRFYSGTESQEYADDPANTAIYDINTIANYDPAIIPLLESPIGTAFARRGLFKRFVAVPFEADGDVEA